MGKLLGVAGIVSGVFIALYIAFSNPLEYLQQQYKPAPENQFSASLIQNNTRIGLIAHQMVNEQRTEMGLKPLVWDERLSEIAATHSQDMASRDYFAHEDPEGRNHAYRYDVYGYDCFSSSGENLYKHEGLLIGYSDEKIAEEAVIGWMNSEGHRENIVYEGFGKEGIGVYLDSNAVYVTQNFC